jgi:2-aminoadipate transaminase
VQGHIDELIITTGSQQGLDLAGRVLLDPGDVVLVERPTYSGAIAAFRNLGADLVDVAPDDDGPRPDAVAETAERLRAAGRRARVLYVTPNFQNPSGMLMAPRRRLALLDVAARCGLVIVEDDPYGSLYFDDARAEDTRAIKADDAEGRVVYLGSVSKTLAPGFRTAWMLAPAAIARHVELAKQAADISSGVFDQRIVHQAIVRGVLDRVGPTLRATYQARRDAMEDALRTTLGERARWRRPHGGFFLWVQAPGTDTDRLFDAALAEGVSFVPGSAFFADPSAEVSDRASWLRLAFSAVPPERIREGVARLARALAR